MQVEAGSEYVTLATLRHVFSQPSGLKALEGPQDKLAGLSLLRRYVWSSSSLITQTTQHVKKLGDF